MAVSYAPAGRPLALGIFLILISVRDRVEHRAIVRLERLGHLNNPMTSPRIELAIFWPVVQCLHLEFCTLCKAIVGVETNVPPFRVLYSL
jgi:hypothetical protein